MRGRFGRTSLVGPCLAYVYSPDTTEVGQPSCARDALALSLSDPEHKTLRLCREGVQALVTGVGVSQGQHDLGDLLLGIAMTGINQFQLRRAPAHLLEECVISALHATLSSQASATC
jgi:hypothetical protein